MSALKAENMPEEPNFYDAVTPRLVTKKSIPFLKAIRFVQLFSKFTESTDDPKIAAARFLTLLRSIGVDTKTCTQDEAFSTLNRTMAETKPHPQLAWQRPIETPSGEPQTTPKNNLEYEGRTVAWIVALLASNFGWTPDYILNELTTYEVSCYVQEALLLNHEQLRWQYSFAGDIGIEKIGGEYVKKPFPDLPWIVEDKSTVLPKGNPLPPGAAPDGFIIDYTHKPGEGTKRDVETKELDDNTRNVFRAKGVGDGSLTKTS